MEDVVPLAEFFLKRFGLSQKVRLEDSAKNALLAYPWPGNVRELANAMERAGILAGDSGRISRETLSFLEGPAACETGDGNIAIPAGGLDLEALEKDLVRQAMDRAGNNQTAAAKLLGLSRAKFRVLMKQAFTEG
jgi:transcriptional regulator with PAS, ATPase and Fis domain